MTTIYAGYMSWRHSDFGLNPEHPPLVKLVAALPLLRMPVRVPALQGRFFKHEAFLGGKDTNRKGGSRKSDRPRPATTQARRWRSYPTQ
jgi:hypothetical protein